MTEDPHALRYHMPEAGYLALLELRSKLHLLACLAAPEQPAPEDLLLPRQLLFDCMADLARKADQACAGIACGNPPEPGVGIRPPR